MFVTVIINGVHQYQVTKRAGISGAMRQHQQSGHDLGKVYTVEVMS